MHISFEKASSSPVIDEPYLAYWLCHLGPSEDGVSFVAYVDRDLFGDQPPSPTQTLDLLSSDIETVISIPDDGEWMTEFRSVDDGGLLAKREIERIRDEFEMVFGSEALDILVTEPERLLETEHRPGF